MHVKWMWMRFGSRFGPISNQFWAQFGVPKLLPKWSENSLFWVPFLEPFFMRSWSSSSASWEPFWASDAHLGSLQDMKSMVFLLQNDTFRKWYFLVLWSSSWPSWTHLGSFLARFGPKTVPKISPEITPKWSQKWSKKLPPQKWILRRFWASIWDNFGPKNQHAILPQHLRFSFRFHKTA